MTCMSREAARGGAKYRRIADDLRAAISDGTYAPGDRLPGENALMDTYGVARMTARQALGVLQHEGLTITRKGAGVFVRDFRPIVRDGIARLSRERWGTGRGIWDNETEPRTLTVDSISVSEEKAAGYVADALGVDAGEPIIVRRRRYLLDERPVMVAVSSFPATIARGTAIAESDTGPGGVYARLVELGRAPVHFREDIRARMPGEPDEDLFPGDGGTPLFIVARIAYGDDGRPVELNEMTLDASVYVLRYDFDA